MLDWALLARYSNGGNLSSSYQGSFVPKSGGNFLRIEEERELPGEDVGLSKMDTRPMAFYFIFYF